MNPSNFQNPTASGTTQSGTGATSASSGQSTSSAGQTARDAAAKLKTAASETAHRAAETAETVASEKKDQAAAQVEGYGSAIHQTAKSLEEQDPNLAWLTHQAADRLQRLAEYVRERDFRSLRTDAENLARRHPAAFFGGMCVAGFILGSALKATQRDNDLSTQYDETGTSYDPDRYEQGQETLADAPSAPAAAI